MSKRIALVTGGTGGIGTEICKALCRQGRTVFAGYATGEQEHARTWQTNMAADGYGAEIIEGDVSNYEASARMVADIEQRFGPVEVLVNCAGITRDRTLRKMEPEDWDAVIRTNLDSVYNVTRHVVNGMTERGFGRIVNIASVNGQKGQFGQTNYSSAKAGIHGFTMALAQEVARKGVTVNTVSPGYIATRMTEAVPLDIREQIVATIPVGRMGEPAEIARAVAFLTDDDNRYITGANLPVNGGFYMSF
jgi:acetoacetyl-CoA reductase